MAVSDKSVLRVPDLLDWIVTPNTNSSLTWDRGTKGVSIKECQPPSPGSTCPLPEHKLGPGPGLDLSDVERVRAELGWYKNCALVAAAIYLSVKVHLNYDAPKPNEKYLFFQQLQSNEENQSIKVAFSGKLSALVKMFFTVISIKQL